MTAREYITANEDNGFTLDIIDTNDGQLIRARYKVPGSTGALIRDVKKGSWSEDEIEEVCALLLNHLNVEHPS